VSSANFPLIGEKNGLKSGKMLNIAANVVKKIKINENSKPDIPKPTL
tara:strand:+ start:195 stop:335 length:141 start_codon:yes stop_codon:yes gene_type:complete